MLAPANAPTIIARMAALRRCQRGLSPPAKLESAARPVIVKVRTVVVISGTASFLTTAFLSPMESAVTAMTACNWSGWISAVELIPNAEMEATPSNTASRKNARSAQAWLRAPKTIRPPRTAPAPKAINATAERDIESPGAPAKANPSKTRFPVMLAVKTCPRAR